MTVYCVFEELIEYSEEHDDDYRALRCIFDTLEKAEEFLITAYKSEYYVIEEMVVNSEEVRGK